MKVYCRVPIVPLTCSLIAAVFIIGSLGMVGFGKAWRPNR